jgi:hypothetical protein
MGHIKPKTVSELMDVAKRLADGEDAYHKKERDHPKTTGLTGIATRGEDLATTTTTSLTAK